jgi:acyl-CoA synthetase (AMP-forming)/AMP-acid ligase II
VSVGLAIARQARRRPDAVALFDARQRRSWAELDRRTNQLATVLSDQFEVRPGDRVALLSPNRIEVAEVLGGTHKAGAVYVGLNFRMNDNDLDGAMENAQPRLLIFAGEFSEEGQALADRHQIAWLNLDDTGERGYEATVSAASPDAPRGLYAGASDDDACIVYTSGTTGSPKGVLFTHAAMMQHALVACLEYEITPESRYLIQIPHNSSVNITMMPCFAIGAALGFSDSRNFDPVDFANVVSAQAVTHTFLVPTQLMRILDCSVDITQKMKTLETLGYGSSPISPDRLGLLIERFGSIFIQLYGMAEIASIGTLLRKDDHRAALGNEPRLLRSAGQSSFAVIVRVVDGDGRDVKVGERGEVIFSGPHMMKGYYREPDRTSEVLVDGWIRSGDVAEIDDRGYLYIVDRMKHLIIRGGQNIAATDIENAFYRHPAILEVAVIGAPDPEWGERIVAVVALRAGQEVSEDALLAHVASELPKFIRPEEVQFVDVLPKNAVGKIDKQKVRRPFWSAERQV